MKSKGNRTSDIHTIFRRTIDYVHPTRGRSKGHFCVVCRKVYSLNFDMLCNILPREKGVRQSAYLFSGGTSTLRTHIAR